MSFVYHRSFSSALEGKYAKVAEKLPPKGTILEVGCHTGYFSCYLLNLGYQVLGIENNSEAAQLAIKEGVEVICGNIEEASLLSSIHKKFDVILLMDVIEHLKEPTATLIQLKQLINPGGKVIVTGPNVAYWAIRKNLLFGKWVYTDSGIMDRTHLHFYTASTWRAVIEEAGYKVISLNPAEGMLPLENFLSKLATLKESVNWLRRLATSAAPELFTVVYLLEAIPEQ